MSLPREVIDGPLGQFVPVYIGDYLTWTTHLGAEEHGALILLLLHHWNGGVISDDDRALSRLTKLSFRRWKNIRPNIQEFFRVEDWAWTPTLDVFTLKGRKSLPNEVRLAIFKRDSFTCNYCGASRVRLECDHVFPVSRGGTDDEWNLVTACVPCNRSKGAKTLEEWLS